MIRRMLLEWAEHEVDSNWDLSKYHDLNGEAHYQPGFDGSLPNWCWITLLHRLG